MKYLRTYIWLIMFIPCFCFGEQVTTNNDALINTLKQRVSQTIGPERIKYLNKLADYYWNVPQEEYWNKRLFNECIKYDSLKHAESALSSLSTYYHNNNMGKQLLVCSHYADILAQRLGFYSSYYFSVKTSVCKRFLWDERYNEAITQTTALLNLAIRVNNKSGQAVCDELLGLIYQMMERHQKAIPYFRSALSLVTEDSPQDFHYRAQLMTTIIEEALKLNQLKEVYNTITSFEKIQKDVVTGKYGKDTGFPIARNERMMCSYYMDYYIRLKNYKMAQAYMQRAKAIKQTDVYVDFLIDYESALYYMATQKYKQALTHINRVIEVDGGTTLEYRMIRAKLYGLMGHWDDSAEEYRKCIELKNDSAQSSFDKQLAQLQSLRNSMQLQLQLKNNEIHIRKLENNILFGASAFLLIMAITFGFYLYRNHKLRKLLENDKVVLNKSREELQLALHRAGEVDQMKNIFIRNVSHEIRTPLNAIVGFSSILTSEFKATDEQKEYGRIINDNASSLLTLVNNIIDLSVLKSSTDIDSENIKECNLTSICQRIISIILEGGKVKEGVHIEFQGTPPDYLLNTNSEHLDQVLINLMTNAVKYTEKGTITLKYELDSENHQVIFSVTDTGKGISPKLRDNLFKHFEKGGSLVQGLGLGLSLCQILVNGFGGEIYLDDSYTSGARFIFTHPTISNKQNNIK